MSIASLMSHTVHSAHITVKAKSTPICVQNARMEHDDEDTRPDEAKRLEAARIKRGFKSARAACEYFGWNYTTYSQHERGERGLTKATSEKYARAYRVSQAWLLTGSAEGTHNTSVKVMGFVGAGAEVMPEFEQVPPEGLDTIDLPFSVPEDIIALKIRGDSMLPVYRDGDAILVWKDQRLATENYIGEEAAVRTEDGRRFLKELQRGSQRGIFNLYSHNARLIEDVSIAWVGEIYLTVRAPTIKRVLMQQRASSTRQQNRRLAETRGMGELPLIDDV